MRNLLALLALGFGCEGFLAHQAAGPTSTILEHAQPSLQQESDYELASRAVPGALKTIEGFYVADENEKLRAILMEGYCQYATAFVEDEWELAKFKKDLDAIAYHNERASKMFERCMNYALMDLGADWEKDVMAGTPEVATKRINNTTYKHRAELMWAGLGLGGMLNHNLTRVDMLAYIPTVKTIVDHVIDLDEHAKKNCGKNSACTVHLALPHIAKGMLNSAASAQFGGNAEVAAAEFQKALQITGDRMLLARVLWAYRVGLMTNNRKLFHEQLVKVLDTDPGIWPEQRLANEVAHRRAKRYLSHEKDLFQ